MFIQRVHLQFLAQIIQLKLNYHHHHHVYKMFKVNNT